MATCRFCGTDNRDQAAYCNACGGALDSTAPPHAAGATAGAPSGATAGTAHATGRLPPHTLIGGRYHLVKVVGQGGMAAVYQAASLRSNRIVALKEMSQDGLTPDEAREALASFHVEADMLLRLRHPNLPRVYECFSEGARHYLAMEFVDGRTLEQRQAAAGGKALPEPEVMDWASQLCDALTYLHGQRPPIIFRDLKPANIMVTAAGQVKLIDFGIARVFASGHTRDTQALGTPGYAPPEQYGKAQTDARADVYALGCALYQLLTGDDPAATPFALPPMHTRNPAISPHIQRAIERATQLDRDARYPTAAAFKQDLLRPPGLIYRSGECAHGATELLALCRVLPQASAEHLAYGRIEGWLRTWGEPALADAAAHARTAHPNRDAALGAFLAAAARAGSGGTARPRRRGAVAAASAAAPVAAPPMVQPQSVYFGELPAGQRGLYTISVAGIQGAPTSGSIAPQAPWLTARPTRFAGACTIVQLVAETARIPSPGAHQTTLRISSAGGQVHVPVTITVRALAAPAPAAATPPPAPPGAKPAPVAGLRTPRLASFLLSLVLALSCGSAAWLLAARALAQWMAPSELPASVRVGALLLLATGGAVVGAMAGAASGAVPSGAASWRARLVTALVGAFGGLALALVSSGGQVVAPHAASVSTGLLAPARLALATTIALSALGAAAGADARYSHAMRRVGGLLRRLAQPLAVVLGIALGAWLGWALLATVLDGVFAWPALLVGAVAGGALANRVVRPRRARLARMRP